MNELGKHYKNRNHDDLSKFGNRLWFLMQNKTDKAIESSTELAKELFKLQLVTTHFCDNKNTSDLI